MGTNTNHVGGTGTNEDLPFLSIDIFSRALPEQVILFQKIYSTPLIFGSPNLIIVFFYLLSLDIAINN